jgi:translation initiation factor 1
MSQNVIFNFVEADLEKMSQAKTHIRSQQTGRRHITTIQGIDSSLNLYFLLRTIKKRFNCNGSVKEDKETKEKVLQISGDQRRGIKEFLVGENIVEERNVIVHGA